MALPVFAPTQAPARQVRGGVVLACRDFASARVPGGLAAVGLHLSSDALRDFLLRPFAVHLQYDLAAVIELGNAAARAARVPHLAFVRMAARTLAGKHARGPVRPTPASATPELVVTRLPGMVMHAFDFGPATVQKVSPTHFRALVRGVPSELVSWLTAVAEGYVPAALEQVGARQVDIKTRAPTRDGGDLALIFEIRWS